MKKIFYFLSILFFLSCTSNTILEKPKDLIPKDSMSLLIEEMMIASSAKYLKNIYQENEINYMALVFERFHIDSTRFQKSNLYYMSKVDDYQKILDKATASLEAQKKIYTTLKSKQDSLRKDSIQKLKPVLKRADSIKLLTLDSISRY